VALFAAYRPVLSVQAFDPQYAVGFREWRLARGVTTPTTNKQIGYLNRLLDVAVHGTVLAAIVAWLRHDSLAKQRRSLSLAEVLAQFVHRPEYQRTGCLTTCTSRGTMLAVRTGRHEPQIVRDAAQG
jgi:hypothetical protein